MNNGENININDASRSRGVIAVIGTTGVGKSNLAVALAKDLEGEVINGDALQVYKGLDIITNKMPMDEREGVPHHLMDFLAMEKEYSVLDFKADALDLISEIESREKLPVVVGGTHYYIQSLLWKDTLLDTKKNVGTAAAATKTIAVDEHGAQQEQQQLQSETQKFLEESDTDTLYKKLKEVDPIMANKWHEHDRRKITRSLQVFFETGERQSDLIRKQHDMSDNERLRMPVCIFWVYSSPDILNARLDARVDSMISGGLFDEIRNMRSHVGSETDYERGIWQAIGYKEFDGYFKAVEQAQLLSQPTDTPALELLKADCTELMKVRTRQYAKRQVAWIRNKILALCEASSQNNSSGEDIQAADKEASNQVRIYLLDATDLKVWKENVSQVASKIAKDFFAGKYDSLPEPSSLNLYAEEMLGRQRRNVPGGGDPIAALESWEKKECKLCTEMLRIMHDKNGTARGNKSKGDVGSVNEAELPGPVIIHGPTGWEQHLKSKQHRKLKTCQAEMEREGENWWFWRAQEYKKRKREAMTNVNAASTTSGVAAGDSEVNESKEKKVAEDDERYEEEADAGSEGQPPLQKRKSESI